MYIYEPKVNCSGTTPLIMLRSIIVKKLAKSAHKYLDSNFIAPSTVQPQRLPRSQDIDRKDFRVISSILPNRVPGNRLS